MDINYLHSDELDFELTVRGYPIEGTVADKRKRLRPALRLERDGAAFSSPVGLDPQNEIRVCEEKVQELQLAVDQFNFANATNEYKRFRSRLLHIVGRLNRVNEQEHAVLRGQLLVRCGEISDYLEETILLLQPVEVPSFASALPAEAGTSTAGSGTVPDVAAKAGDNNDGQKVPNVNPSRNTSLIDVDPRDLGTIIQDLQLNSPVQPIVGPVMRTGTASGASTSAMPAADFPQPVSWVPKPVIPNLRQNAHTAHTQPVDVGQTFHQAANTNPQSPMNTSEVVLRSPPANVGQSSRRVSFAHEPEFSVDSRPIDRARIFKTVSQWNLKFDGVSGLNTFLGAVEELRIACGFSQSQLMGVAVILFRGAALDWFRANISLLHTWDDLVSSLKTAFLPGQYEEDIWADIRTRTQGQYERATAYISVMQNLFNKLSKKPSEMTKLRVVRRNLLPYIQMQLALTDCDSISELTVACQRIEDAQARIERFKPPPTNPNLVTEQELMYSPRKGRQQVGAVVATALPHSGQAFPCSNSPAPIKPSDQICWNCRQRGHFKRSCTQARAKHCFGCGEPNVTKAMCPRCSGNAGLAR